MGAISCRGRPRICRIEPLNNFNLAIMNIMRLTTYTAPVMILGLLFFSCNQQDREGAQTGTSPAVSPDVRIVATVNGDPITLGEFLERFERAGFTSEEAVAPEVKVEFLNRLIERKMILRAAKRKRMKVHLRELNERIALLRGNHGKGVKGVQETLADQGIDFEKWKADVWENIMIEKVVGREVDRRVSVSDAAVRKYYKAHRDDFKRPDQVRARQIVVTTELEARKVSLQLTEEKTNFAKLAKEKSIAPEAQKGGDLGYFARGEMPPEFNVVFDLKKGEISDVVKSPYGFHVFTLVAKLPAGTRDLKTVYQEIKNVLLQEKREKLYRRWLKQLRAGTSFEVNYQALEQ